MDRTADGMFLIQPNFAYATSYLEARREGYTNSSLSIAGQIEPGRAQLAEHLKALNKPEKGARWADTPENHPVRFAHLWMVTRTEFTKLVMNKQTLVSNARMECRSQSPVKQA